VDPKIKQPVPQSPAHFYPNQADRAHARKLGVSPAAMWNHGLRVRWSRSEILWGLRRGDDGLGKGTA